MPQLERLSHVIRCKLDYAGVCWHSLRQDNNPQNDVFVCLSPTSNLVEGEGVIPAILLMMVRTSLMGDCLATSVGNRAILLEIIYCNSWWWPATQLFFLISLVIWRR